MVYYRSSIVLQCGYEGYRASAAGRGLEKDSGSAGFEVGLDSVPGCAGRPATARGNSSGRRASPNRGDGEIRVECAGSWFESKTSEGFWAVKPVLIDTGAIVALLDRSERHHEACVETLEHLTSPLVTCEAVIAESCYLMRRLPGAAEAVLENVAKGVFRIPLELAAAAP